MKSKTIRFGRLFGLAFICSALSGCWEAEAPLMPVSARDKPDIAGVFDRLPKGKNGSLTIAASANGQFLAVETKADGSKSQSLMSLDELGSIETPSNANTEMKAYILEVAAGRNLNEFYYSLVFTEIVHEKIVQIVHMEPACSKAATRIIGKTNFDERNCVFTSYDQVRAASIDAIEWLEDARIPPNAEVYVKRE